jgi:hypothetical protein
VTKPVTGLLGGAQAAITTSPVAVDLRALAGRSVLVWSDDADLWFTFGDGSSTTLVTAGAEAASLTNLKADRVARGYKAARLISNGSAYLIVRAVSGSGTVHVKVASELNGALGDSEAASSPSLGTVTISDGSGPVTVDGSVSVIQGAPAKTDSTSYITTGNMSADVDGAAITVGPEGRLLLELSWTNTGTPIGTFVLQGLMPSGSYDDIPLSSAAFLRHPNNDTSTSVAYFTDLQVFTSVRLKYRRTSGGTANTSLDVNTRVM